MPFKSDKQRRYLYAKHPDIAKRWSREETRAKARSNVLRRKAAENTSKS